MHKTILTAALAAMLGLAAGAARADDSSKKDTEPARKADNAAKQGPKAPADGLTHEGLKSRLDDMGYEFEMKKSTNGTPMYLVTVNRSDYRFVFYISLSSDLKRVWVTAALRPLPEPGKVRADILEKILAKNHDLGPSYFAVKSNRYLYLDRPLDNHGLYARQLRGELDDFMTAIRSTEPLWNPEKYPAATTPVKDTTKQGGEKIDRAARADKDGK
jgi:hypothetical protein